MTTIEETLTKLTEMRLASMALAVRELMETSPGHQLSFEEKLGIVVDREWMERDNRRLSRRLKDAKLASRASLDNILCDPERGIDMRIVRLEPGASWEAHHHERAEELFLLRGDWRCLGTNLHPGDFHRAGPGTEHAATASSAGCKLIVVSHLDG